MPEPQDTVIFGLHAAQEVLSSRSREIDRVYFSSGRQSPEQFKLLKKCRKQRIPYQTVPQSRLDQIAGNRKHQGVVIQCTAKAFTGTDELVARLIASPRPSLVLVPASVEDPGNLGAIIRSSVAFGVSALLLERKHTAPMNVTVARASAGMLEHISIAKPRSLEATLERLREAGFAIVGMDAHEGVKPEAVDMCGPTVLLAGGEHRGLPPYLRRQCTATVCIPMTAHAESLNVSASAAALLYECARQRKFLYE
jgi:23S rRNA (guanosine2251-2'-O)-methyltransferase